MSGAIICSFEAVELPKGTLSDYEAFKVAVLSAGRFSVFEATRSMRRAKLFERLMRDPEVEQVEMGFPWTGVRWASDSRRIRGRPASPSG